MLNIEIVHVGIFKEAYWKAAYGEYEKRISRYARLISRPIKEFAIGENPAEGEIETALCQEGKAIVKLLADRQSYKIALCVEGEPLSSPEFARVIDNLCANGSSAITFVIGGSYGLSPEVKAACDKRVSFSGMTFPHQLARILLSEQLYRALNRNAGGKYHK